MCWNADLAQLHPNCYSYLHVNHWNLRGRHVSSVPSHARDVIGVDPESVPWIIKYTLNVSACMENDLWMSFKQHASVCNLPNELCGSDLRLVKQYRAMRFSLFYNKTTISPTAWKFGAQFPYSSFTSSHCGFGWWVESVSADSYFRVSHLIFLSFSQRESLIVFQDFFSDNMSVKWTDTISTFFFTVIAAAT